MRAAICTRYGPPEVLRIQDIERPAPKDDEVLIKIHATAVTSSDGFVRSGLEHGPFMLRIMMRLVVGFTGPRNPILGMVLAGEIVETGKAVRRFRAGDRVFAFTMFRFGCHAEYTCVRETSAVAPAPSNLTCEEAAAIPYGGLLALFLLRGRIQSGLRVLVYGASGAVGTAAVQLAKHFGANVTAVCGASNLELARSLGADAVIDYTKETAPPALYDLVFDAVGKRKTSPMKEACRTALAPGGKYLSVDEGRPRHSAGDLELLRELVETGRLKPVIDRRYPLEQIVEAHRYVEQGHKKGNVIITVASDDA